MFKLFGSVLVFEVSADLKVDELLTQMNLNKDSAKNFLDKVQIDTDKLQASSRNIAKELGLENGISLKDLDKSAHEMANDFGLDGYFTQFENQAKAKLQGLDGSVMKQGQQILQHMQQRAGTEGIGAALKNGMSEAMAVSQSNPAMRETLTPLKEGFQKYKNPQNLMYDAASYAAHNPMVEQMLESNGVHVNDLLHRLEPSDPTGAKGLDKLMDSHRAEVEAEFDANNSHFSYFFSFVIFVVLCAIAVALYEIYELKHKKKSLAAKEISNLV